MPAKLMAGVAEFQKNAFPRYQDQFRSLAGGQRPLALFITCSDSRIDPNLLTQTQPGELFVLRNAGNMVPPHTAAGGGEAATIEYAVDVLRVPDIIVCGHSHCGAMQAAMQPESAGHLGHVCRWIELAQSARRVVESWPSEMSPEERLNAVIQRNTLAQLDHLRTYPCVAAALERQSLNLHAWVYRFESGEVLSYDTSEGRFVPLKTDSISPQAGRAKNASTRDRKEARR